MYFFLILAACYFLLTTVLAHASTLSNEKYILEIRPITNYSEDLIEKNQAVEEKEVFPPSFVFTISDSIIDFGILSPTNPVIRTQNISVSPGITNGYSVYILEDHALRIQDTNQIIPDTTCDNGTCTAINASAWENILVYGVGVRCDNPSLCENKYRYPSYFTSLANKQDNIAPQPIMQSRNKDEAKITYKINISPTQPNGLYTNTITYIASPNF